MKSAALIIVNSVFSYILRAFRRPETCARFRSCGGRRVAAVPAVFEVQDMGRSRC